MQNTTELYARRKSSEGLKMYMRKWSRDMEDTVRKTNMCWSHRRNRKWDQGIVWKDYDWKCPGIIIIIIHRFSNTRRLTNLNRINKNWSTPKVSIKLTNFQNQEMILKAQNSCIAICQKANIFLNSKNENYRMIYLTY